MKKLLASLLLLLMIFNVVSFADQTPAEQPTNVEVEVTTETAPSQGILGLSVTTWLIILVGALLLILLISVVARGNRR